LRRVADASLLDARNLIAAARRGARARAKRPADTQRAPAWHLPGALRAARCNQRSCRPASHVSCCRRRAFARARRARASTA